MPGAAHIFSKLSERLNQIALIGAAAAIAVMLGAAGYQVVARYILSQPPAWTEEIARFSMVWAALLGASCAFYERLDPTLFPNAAARTGLLGRVFAVIRALGVFLFVAPILWFSVFGLGADPTRGYIARIAGRQAETMEVPMLVFGLAIPVAFTIILIHLVADFLSQIAKAH